MISMYFSRAVFSFLSPLFPFTSRIYPVSELQLAEETIAALKIAGEDNLKSMQETRARRRPRRSAPARAPAPKSSRRWPRSEALCISEAV